MAMGIDQVWGFWQQKFLIMEQCIPKGSLPKRKCAPWISKQIFHAICKRNTCYRRAKQTGSPELLSKYKHLRNKVVHMVNKRKRNYLNNLKSASCKDLWKAVKNLNGRQCSIPTLSKFLNLSITTGKLPSAYKTSSVVPIPKTENKSDAKNYRPISLLSVISKILERHIYGKILMHLQSAYPL